MKLSVSVPDELWKEVAGEDESPSEVVQRALRAEASRRTSRHRELRTREQETRMERIRDRLRHEAQRAFAQGYDLGLEMADELPWAMVARLATAGTSGSARTAILRLTEEHPEVAGVFERFASAWELDPTALDGASQAFRDLAESVTAELPSSSASSWKVLSDVMSSHSRRDLEETRRLTHEALARVERTTPDSMRARPKPRTPKRGEGPAD